MRRKLFIWTSAVATTILILGAVVQLGTYIYNYNNPTYTAHEVFSEWILAALVGMAGLSGTLYTAARALPGSPELTPPDVRGVDSTIKVPGAPDK